MRPVVLDSEALSLVARPDQRSYEVMAALKAAARNGRGPLVPAVVLAEQYRSRARVAAVNSVLDGRSLVIRVCDTDRALAQLVGSVLAASGASSSDMVDAHCVAVAVQHGGGTVLTSDVGDIERLAAPFHPGVPVSAARI